MQVNVMKKYLGVIQPFSCLFTSTMTALSRKPAKGMIFVQNGGAPAGLEFARRAVSKIDGVFELEANHVAHLLIFEYDQDKVTLEQIRKVVENASRRAMIHSGSKG